MTIWRDSVMIALIILAVVLWHRWVRDEPIIVVPVLYQNGHFRPVDPAQPFVLLRPS